MARCLVRPGAADLGSPSLSPLTQPVPGVLVVQLLGALQRHVDVAALHRQVEARALVLDKVQRNLREVAGMEVGSKWGAGDGGMSQAGQGAGAISAL